MAYFYIIKKFFSDHILYNLLKYIFLQKAGLILIEACGNFETGKQAVLLLYFLSRIIGFRSSLVSHLFSGQECIKPPSSFGNSGCLTSFS